MTKNKKGFVIATIILAVLVAVMGSYITYDKFIETDYDDVKGLYTYTSETIEDEYDEPRRWQRNHTKWVKINGRYFELNADEALTELQDTDYWRQPQEVSYQQVTRTITVTENQWTYIERKK